MRLVKAASTVYVGRGQKFMKHSAKPLLADEDSMAKLLGPTGNLRAPTLRRGKTVIVGFDEETYRSFLC